MKNFIVFLIFASICLGVGFLGSFFTTPAINGWYSELAKPSFNPPSWIFGPVWTLLYFLMAVSAFLVWRKWSKNHIVRCALILFFVHLIFNFLWSIIFFTWQSPGWALVDVLLLDAFIIAMIVVFYKVDKRASFLLFPYLAWVLFATVLNYYIFILN